MAWRVKKGSTHSSHAVEEELENKMDTANAQYVNSNTKIIILSPKISKKGKHMLKMEVSKLND